MFRIPRSVKILVPAVLIGKYFVSYQIYKSYFAQDTTQVEKKPKS